MKNEEIGRLLQVCVLLAKIGERWIMLGSFYISGDFGMTKGLNQKS